MSTYSDLVNCRITSKVRQISKDTTSVVSSANVFNFLYESQGRNIEAFICCPSVVSRPLPCVIFNKGGAGGRNPIGDNFILRMMIEIASWGFVVVASQYPGCGASEGKDELGGKDVQDVLNLKTILDQLMSADSSRIGMYGISRGGMMSYLAATRVDWIKVLISNSGVSDLVASYAQREDLREIDDELTGGKKEDLMARSVIYFPERMSRKTSYFLLHGDNDESVAASDSITLNGRLQALGYDCSLYLFESGDHALNSHRAESKELLMRLLEEFL